MSKAVCLLRLYAFMAWTGKSLALPLIFICTRRALILIHSPEDW